MRRYFLGVARLLALLALIPSAREASAWDHERDPWKPEYDIRNLYEQVHRLKLCSHVGSLERAVARFRAKYKDNPVGQIFESQLNDLKQQVRSRIGDCPPQKPIRPPAGHSLSL